MRGKEAADSGHAPPGGLILGAALATFASFGSIGRRQQLSFDRGVILSDGKTHASSRVSAAFSRHVSISRSNFNSFMTHPSGSDHHSKVRGFWSRSTFRALQKAPSRP